MINQYWEIKLTDAKILNIKTECVYYLSEGIAQLWELHSDGEEILINILKPDDAVMLPNIQFGSVYELRTDSRKIHFFVYKWNRVNSIEEKYFLLNKVTQTLLRVETFNQIKRQKFVKNRLIALVSFLAQEHGESLENNRFIIKNLFTHEQLASLVLSTRTTVTRILNELKKEKIITYLNGYICLNANFTENINDSEKTLKIV